jgi:hypothetical protein
MDLLLTSAANWPTVQAPDDDNEDDDDECGAVSRERINRGNQSTRRKSTQVPFCPPQIPYDLNCDRRTRAAGREGGN